MGYEYKVIDKNELREAFRLPDGNVCFFKENSCLKKLLFGCPVELIFCITRWRGSTGFSVSH